MSASPKQVALAEKLLAERIVPDAIVTLVKKALADPKVTPGKFSPVIGTLFALPEKAPKVLPALAAGLYLHDGTVYEVQVSKSSGRPYAKVLSPASGRFTYVSGAIYELPADAQAITIDQALEFGLKHGMCVKGHPLTDPVSVKLGIGPDCCKSMFGMTQAQLLKQREGLLV